MILTPEYGERNAELVAMNSFDAGFRLVVSSVAGSNRPVGPVP